ncbi:hypothetical protein C8R46DRAFT_1064348 [Mycena filopes]|nr:hypothetical protein C8R46DRAFT_1064348 [Mycena filopes]
MSNETSPFVTSDTLAPLAIGGWLNLVLFTVEVVQATQYFRSAARPRDSVFIKLGVGLNLLADFVGTLACCATTYLYTLTYWGNTEALEKRYWPLTVIVITVGVATAVSQLFMIMRYWQMTRHHIVFALMVLILLGAVAGIFGSGVLMALSLDVERMLHDGLVLLGVLASIVGTAVMSSLLFVQLCKRNDYCVTKWNFPKRIACALLETGTITTLVVITGSAMAAYMKTRYTMVWIIFAFIVARVYSCTMLFALSMRPKSTLAMTGNAAQAVDTSDLKFAPVEKDQTISKPPVPLVAVLEDSDAFRLTKKKIDLHERDFDSDSDVSRNLNDELHDMDREDRRSSFTYSRRESLESRDEDSASEYPGSPTPGNSLPFSGEFTRTTSV